jgi:hypothetical protein
MVLRFQAISIFYYSLKSVLAYFRNMPRKKIDGIAAFTLEKLKTFKYIYQMYFLANLLYNLVVLLKISQNKYVDVTNIGSFINIKVESICTLYAIEIMILKS